MSKIKFQTYEPAMWTQTQEILLESIPHPVPAGKLIPDYYKKLLPKETDEYGNKTINTVKRCPPFIDIMTEGYIIPLWWDITCLTTEDTGEIRFKQLFNGYNPVSDHSKEQFKYHPYQDKYPYSHVIAKFISPWLITTPPGWSCLFTSPFNHLESRFKLFDAIVDTDKHYMTINFPFVWTGLETGQHVIKKGTPLVQVIPFKRDENLDFEVSTMSDEDIKKAHIENTRHNVVVENYYRENNWSKRKKQPD